MTAAADPEAFARLAVDLHGEARTVSLRKLLGVENLGLNLFTFGSGEGSRIHRHRRQEELYLVLQGELTIELDSGVHVLSAPEFARVAPHARRQVSNRGRSTCVFVAIGATGAHEGGDAEAFPSWDDLQPRPPAAVPLPDDLST